MSLNPSTFDYLKPTEAQMVDMARSRSIFARAAVSLDGLLPDGPDKTYVLRQLRTIAMWAVVSISRNPDGSPRGDT